MVRLKVGKHNSVVNRYYISIPYGAIKRMVVRHLEMGGNIISIPYGAIKSVLLD